MFLKDFRDGAPARRYDSTRRTLAGLPPIRRPVGAGGRGRSAQPVRRLRDRQRREPQNIGTDYAAAVRRLHDAGVMVNASFVFGLDQDGPDVFDRTVTWTVKQGIETATFHIMTPYPSTGLWRQLESENRIVHRFGGRE
jgi:hypothetical protein